MEGNLTVTIVVYIYFQPLDIYEVEFVYGKKMFKKKTLYAVKWLGWTKS